jgi:type VI secretion system protein ImpF
LLFERLLDERHPDPHEPAPPADWLLDREALRRSIGRELDRLFNTRAPVAAEVLDQRPRSTIDYGIPDLSLYSPGDPTAVGRLAAHLTRAVELYEPRLARPKVVVMADPQRAGSLIADVSGTLQLGDEVEALRFRLMLGGEDGDGERR